MQPILIPKAQLPHLLSHESHKLHRIVNLSIREVMNVVSGQVFIYLCMVNIRSIVNVYNIMQKVIGKARVLSLILKC